LSAAAQSLAAAPEAVPRPRVASSGLSAGRNLRSFGIALLLAAVTVLFACAVAFLIADTFYGYGGLG
jgi:hypothetical protein